MHVGAVSIFEGGPLRDGDGRIRFNEIRKLLQSRLPLVPRLRMRIATPPLRMGLPSWVDDPSFDIDHHVRLVELPSPGTRRQLFDLACTLHMDRLDRSRPLWEVWIVDGLEDVRVAMIQKTHHALVDGVSGVDVATAMLDLTPEPRAVEDDGWTPAPAPTTLALVADSALHAFDAPVAAARWAARSLASPMRQVGKLRSVVSSFAAGPVTAPRTSLNQKVGTKRQLVAITLSLDELKDAGHAAGTKVNDVILTIVAGGLRRLLESRDEAIDVRPHVLVPVSVRTDDQRLGLGNKVASLIVPLPVEIASDRERLGVVAATTARLKEQDQATTMATLMTAADHLGGLGPTLASAVIHHQPLVNLVVTNVPGAPIPLYLLGARLEESVPVVPLAANLDVSIGVLSYQRDVVIGLYADSDTVPDLAVLADGIKESYDGLRARAAAAA
jgi:diacylglycerol O-acyltransferase / wax synthase